MQYAITSKQLTDLYNGKIDLYFLQQMIKENYRDDSPMSTKINSAMKLMAPIINQLMEEKDKLQEELEDEMQKVRDAQNLSSIWSVSFTKKFDDSWQGKTVMYNGHAIVIPENVDVNAETMYVIGDNLISESGDSHHIFIEDFIMRKDGIIQMITGS